MSGATTARTQLVGLLGSPVSHSRSPAIHSAAIEALGLDARYLAFEVSPAALGDALAGLRALGALGANVTLPHKSAVMAHLDRVEPAARAIGAVNTIRREGALLVGSNTDAAGLVRSLAEAGVDVAGRRALVLGAGGAARAAVVGLERAGASVSVSARREAAARALGAATVVWSERALREAFESCELLVQATSATLGGAEAAQAFAAQLPIDALPERCAVIDLVYAPRETAVLRRANERGLHTVDGLGMLVWQAALAFEQWFGVTPPVHAMRAAAEA